MKESQLYLQFFRTYFLVLVIPMLIGGIWAVRVVWDKTPQFVSERMFEFPYTYETAAAVEKQSEEAVTLLRSPQLKEQLGMQSTVVTVFKPGPFAIKLQTKNPDAETSVTNLNKLSKYMAQSYPVREIGTEVSFIEREDWWKLEGLGLLGGFGIGLVFSLILAYFRNF